MPRIEKTSIALLPEVVELVRDAVNTSEYASSSEVIPEALPDWRRKGQVQDALKEMALPSFGSCGWRRAATRASASTPKECWIGFERNYQAMTGAIEAAK